MDREVVTRVVVGDPGDDGGFPPKPWWARYRERLVARGLTPTSVRVVALDSAYVVEQGVFGEGAPDEPGSNWPRSRLRRGLVMGSVQSGKTSSMLAVAAKALDRGVNIVVFLAGTRLALWRQTFERIIDQLDGWTIAGDDDRRVHRVLIPSPRVVPTDEGLILGSLSGEHPNLVARMLTERRPLIAIVMKHPDHLMKFAAYLRTVLARARRDNRSLHLLVFDDEADDGSILDAATEVGLEADAEGRKQIPRHITRLWADSPSSEETFDPRLFATYIAYTATPQANCLQSDHNPLSPTSFIVALRTPFEEGSVEPPRTSTFAEPQGVSAYYIGGETFYRRSAGDPGALCVGALFPERGRYSSEADFELAVAAARSELLSNALRAYFVSGALRLLHSGRRFSIANAAGPVNSEQIRQLVPPAHSMLYHPSPRVDEHFAAAEEVSRWSRWPDTHPSNGDDVAAPYFSSSGLAARLDAEEDMWREWVSRFEMSRRRLSFLSGALTWPSSERDSWSEVRRILRTEVFPNTRIAIINSDPRADDRPRFDPQPVSEDRYVSPTDVYTVFVSGNVMARGLTLEGLATTLFLRSANEPLADAQMQMQRWCGYRGQYLPWCRVLMFADQLHLFRAYHEDDEALRSEILTQMNRETRRAPTPLVLQGQRYQATGKIANLRALPLCPGSDPFVRVIETGESAGRNSDILQALLAGDEWVDVVVGGRIRGKGMLRELDLLESAALLESFRYSDHDPDPKSPEHDRWRAISAEIDLGADEAPLFRPPGEAPSHLEKVNPPHCPYSIAAYLRLWHALLHRRARGFHPTDDSLTPWSMIDLSAYARAAPRFRIGVRYGSAGLCANPGLAGRGILRVERRYERGILSSTWGSRNPGEGDDAYLGDQLFDYHHLGGEPPRPVPGEPVWRQRGAPGQILFHVIAPHAGDEEAVTVGVSIPLGGPDHLAALRPHVGPRR